MKRHLCCVTSSLSRKPRANKAFNVLYVNLKAIKSFKLFNRKMATPQRKNDSWMTVTLFLTRRWLTFNRCLLKTDAVVPTTASVLFCFCKKEMQSMVFPGNKKPSVKLWSQLEFTTWCNWEKLGSHSKDMGGNQKRQNRRRRSWFTGGNIQAHKKKEQYRPNTEKAHNHAYAGKFMCISMCCSSLQRRRKKKPYTHTQTHNSSNVSLTQSCSAAVPIVSTQKCFPQTHSSTWLHTHTVRDLKSTSTHRYKLTTTEMQGCALFLNRASLKGLRELQKQGIFSLPCPTAPLLYIALPGSSQFPSVSPLFECQSTKTAWKSCKCKSLKLKSKRKL